MSTKTEIELHTENEEIVAELHHHFPVQPRLTMDQRNNPGFRGLHIYLGDGVSHYVAEQVRDPLILIEIVRAFMYAHQQGLLTGQKTQRATILNALGFTIDDNKVSFVDA